MGWLTRLTESWRDAKAEGDAARQAYEDTKDGLGAPELVEDINREFPPDQREADYARRRDEQYEADEPDPEQPGLLRIIPAGKAADSAWEYPRQREVRGEPDPYNPLHFPSYSYWPPGVEAAE